MESENSDEGVLRKVPSLRGTLSFLVGQFTLEIIHEQEFSLVQPS